MDRDLKLWLRFMSTLAVFGLGGTAIMSVFFLERPVPCFQFCGFFLTWSMPEFIFIVCMVMWIVGSLCTATTAFLGTAD